MVLTELSAEVGNAASKVHKELGPFLSPSIYRSCMMMELRRMGIRVQSQVPIPVFYRGKKVKGEEFVIDLLVGNGLIVEIIALERILEFHERRMLMYLQIARKPMGLLINFGERVLMTAFESSAPLDPSLSSPSDSNPLRKGCTIKEIIKDEPKNFHMCHRNGFSVVKRFQQFS